MRLTGCAALLLAAFAIGCAAPGSNNTQGGAAKPVVRLQTRPRVTNMAKAKEAVPDHVMQMELEFAMRNQAQFNQLVSEINDPHSSRYQQWITPEEMHQKFGESQADFDAVLNWLKAQGFTVTDQNYGSNSDFIRFKGTVAQVDRAFQTDIVEPDFELYAPREDPVIPAQFAGIIARINGLDNVGFMSSE